MKLSEFKKLVKIYLDKNDIPYSDTALNSIISKRFINRQSLKEMTQKDIREAAHMILNDAIRQYKRRQKEASRRIILRDIDINPVLRKKFCSLPPFCRK